MPVMPGTHTLKEVTGEYDFAVDGGAVSTITLRGATSYSVGNDIPVGSVIEGGYVEVDTVPTSGGSATIAVSVEGAGDLVNAAAISGAPWSSTGRKSIIPAGTGATSVKTTAARVLTIAIATAALTAGKFRIVINYR